mmetsp:Transcript_119152/g.371197  ORF Transcript_119152/g.371197 Transcript_119152/m.371197 type:complete len:81 (-) Transcript_119152:363-605(-)
MVCSTLGIAAWSSRVRVRDKECARGPVHEVERACAVTRVTTPACAAVRKNAHGHLGRPPPIVLPAYFLHGCMAAMSRGAS